MALRQIAQRLQNLSLQSTVLQRSLTSNITARCIHLSAQCSRVLDRKAYPKWDYPSSKNKRWIELESFREKYKPTVRPLPMPKTGGRGPNGRIWNHRRAGGHKRNYRMIDWVRGGSETGEPLVERVQQIMYDPNRSAKIALVAGGERKRYIIATQNMEPGQIVKSSRQLTASIARTSEGDAYPLGCLPIGTLVNSVEIIPGMGSMFARAAGVQAQVIRHTKDSSIVRLPSKREVCVSSRCVATVGRVSNIDHNKRVIGKAGRNRWLGIRPHSGRFVKKTGRFGLKIRPIKQMKTYQSKKRKRSPMKPLNLDMKPKGVKQVYPN